MYPMIILWDRILIETLCYLEGINKVFPTEGKSMNDRKEQECYCSDSKGTKKYGGETDKALSPTHQ